MDKMTIYDIAKKAGVSTATVSRVINRTGQVSEASRKHVQEIIDSYSFIPNAHARGLSGGRTGIVGILVPVISDINHAKIVSELEKNLFAKGFNSLISCTNQQESKRDKYLHILAAKKVDAIIVIGSFVSDLKGSSVFAEVAQEVPIIVVNGLVNEEKVHCVYADEYGALYDLATDLIRKGHRELLYLYDSETFSGTQKMSGFKDALQKSNPQASGTTLMIEVSDEMVQTSRDAVSDLLHRQAAFSAVLAADDSMAIGALKALRLHGIDMPVIGYNNTRYARCSSPELSSIDNNYPGLCAYAADILGRVLNEETVPRIRKLQPIFVPRESYTR